VRRVTAWTATAALLLLGAGAGRASDEADRKAVERENERRAKAGLLPRKEPARPVPSGEPPPARAPAAVASVPLPTVSPSLAPAAPPAAGPSPPMAAPPPAARAAQPPHGGPGAPARQGPLEAAVAAGRGLSPAGAYGGPEVAVDESVAGSLVGLAVRSGLRIRAGEVVLVVDRAR
jgi:hypothetical protein